MVRSVRLMATRPCGPRFESGLGRGETAELLVSTISGLLEYKDADPFEEPIARSREPWLVVALAAELEVAVQMALVCSGGT